MTHNDSASLPPAGFTETQRERRGHPFLPPAGGLPGLGETDGTPSRDKLIPLHYFSAAGDWWIAELDPATGEAYGYAQLASCPGGAEWGYLSLAELERLNVANGLVIVERDLHWRPRRFAEIAEARP